MEFKLETGRTHQIRVHSAYIGHPLLGDDLYGNKSDLINRQALHSNYLKFIHPMTMKPIEFKIDLPEDMQCILPQNLDIKWLNIKLQNIKLLDIKLLEIKSFK